MHVKELLPARALELQTFFSMRFGRNWRSYVLRATGSRHSERWIKPTASHPALVKAENYARSFGFHPADEPVRSPCLLSEK